MKVIFNISTRQLQKALLLSGMNDEAVDKINEALAKYEEIDITDFVAYNDKDNYTALAIAYFAMGTIAVKENV